MMGHSANNYVDRFRRRLDANGDLSFTSRWIERNTRSPKHPDKNWDFKGHEYQIEILNDSARRMCGRKCSQIGFTELMVRKALAMLAIMPASTLIYTLPTSKMASKFAKARFDPVIAHSPALASMLNPDVDSGEMKQFNDSFLYINGTMGQKAAISTPADALISDEKDFSDQTVLSTYASRLGHAPSDEFGVKGWKADFSTPTVPGFGIDADFEGSSQAFYAVKHDECKQWVFPDFMKNVVVPGFDSEFREFRKEDLQNPAYKTGDSFLQCPQCRGKITQRNLCDPEKRQWVHTYPSRRYRGYQVFPFDVAEVNPIHTTVATLEEYKNYSDWVNFKIGLPFEDSQNSFLKSVLMEHRTTRWVGPEKGYASGCIAGLDQGKTSWFVVGKEIDGDLKTIYAERIRQDGNDHLVTRTLELLDIFDVQLMVMDAAPEYSTAYKISQMARPGQVYRCEYTQRASAEKRNLSTDEEDQLVKAYRTGTFDDLCKRANRGLVSLPNHPEGEEIVEHLTAIKRVTSYDGNGEEIKRWIKIGERRMDHYAHALNYMSMAAEMVDEGVGNGDTIPAGPGCGTVRMKSGDQPGQSRLLIGRNRRPTRIGASRMTR